jgi:hypothetical protein
MNAYSKLLGLCCIDLDFGEAKFTSTEKLYSGGRKPIYSDVFCNRQY